MKSELIWSKALETSRKAIDCAAVIPLETYKYKPIKKSFDYELRFLKKNFPKKLYLQNSYQISFIKHKL